MNPFPFFKQALNIAAFFYTLFTAERSGFTRLVPNMRSMRYANTERLKVLFWHVNAYCGAILIAGEATIPFLKKAGYYFIRRKNG